MPAEVVPRAAGSHGGARCLPPKTSPRRMRSKTERYLDTAVAAVSRNGARGHTSERSTGSH